MKILPICNFPTTVLFVDDNKKFLKGIFLDLVIENIVYRSFSTPYVALEYLDKYCPSEPFLMKLISQADETEWEHRALDVNINDLYCEIYNPKRFAQVSTIVIDYDMPGMNGLEFCKKITIPHVRKVILTGAADEQLAVEAFNKGLIDKFINKNSNDLGPQLNAVIEETTQSYFQEISQLFIHILNVSWGTALTDPAFVILFQQLIQQHDIIEYYLFQGIGSFLLLDRNGKDYGLFVKEKKELQAILESEEFEKATPLVQKSFRKFESILCYHNTKDYSLPSGEEWEPYICRANPLKGFKQYYYCLRPHILDLNRDKICSFETYKKANTKNLS